MNDSEKAMKGIKQILSEAVNCSRSMIDSEKALEGQ